MSRNPALPAVATPRPLKVPASAEVILGTGLRIIALRKPGVPLAEVRLRVPLPSLAGDRGDRDDALVSVLTDTLLQGTPQRPGARVVEDLRAVGGALSAGADSDAIVVNGSSLASGLPTLLEVLGDVLTEASHPAPAVAATRERLGQELTIARTVPGLVARTAVARRAFGAHPYARGLTPAAEVAAVTAAQVRRQHARRVVPAGSTLVIVSDLAPGRALAAAERALVGWTGGTPAAPPRALPAPELGPTWLVDRPGSVQSNLRLATLGLPREDPAYPALRLAVMVYGGYFSSRLVANIREDKGWTYSPGSSMAVRPAGTVVSVAADVATDVSAAALWEVLHELGRIATVRVGQDELDDARQYLLGTTALSLASQSGLAGMVTAMSAAGLDLRWLQQHLRDLLAVGVDDVLAAAQDHLGPRRFVGAVVGDATAVEQRLATVVPVERALVEA